MNPIGVKVSLKLNMQATLLNIEGIVCTIATGIYHVLPPDKYKDIIQGTR